MMNTRKLTEDEINEASFAIVEIIRDNMHDYISMIGANVDYFEITEENEAEVTKRVALRLLNNETIDQVTSDFLDNGRL